MNELAAGRIVAGKFRLDQLLARGGMGSVWAASHLVLDVPVAIKFMEPALAASAEARTRFEREAKAAASLRTPHVVQIHDHGVDSELPYIVMELLQGEDLGARLRNDTRLSLPVASHVLTQTAKALRLAHEAGIVHRDLKPGNIFLARTDDDEEVVKILDFGIAKALATPIGESTKTGELLGSPDYMSPEQARGSRQLDARSDLWSLAVIIFRAITGVKAFKGESLGDVIVKICVEPIPVPSQVAPELPPEIDAFFAKALARDPADRFQNAREMAAEFAVAAGGVTWLPGTSSALLDRPRLTPPDVSMARPDASTPTPSLVHTPTAMNSTDAPSSYPEAQLHAAAQTFEVGSRPSATGTLTNASFSSPPLDRTRPLMLSAVGIGVFVVMVTVGLFAVQASSGASVAAESGLPRGAHLVPIAFDVQASTESMARPAAEPIEPPPDAPPADRPAERGSDAAAKASSGAPTKTPPKSTAKPKSVAGSASAGSRKKPDFGY
jgi:serine/threonine-protein kinase